MGFWGFSKFLKLGEGLLDLVIFEFLGLLLCWGLESKRLFTRSFNPTLLNRGTGFCIEKFI